MKLKYNIIINELGDELVGVPISDKGDNFNGVLKFNKETAFIIDLLNNEISNEDLYTKVAENFSVSIDEVKASIDEILLKLKEAELLEE